MTRYDHDYWSLRKAERNEINHVQKQLTTGFHNQLVALYELAFEPKLSDPLILRYFKKSLLDLINDDDTLLIAKLHDYLMKLVERLHDKELSNALGNRGISAELEEEIGEIELAIPPDLPKLSDLRLHRY